MGLSTFRRIRILVVDDRAEVRAMARSMLVDLGFSNIDAAVDGDDAYLKFVLKPAALVITDLAMAPVDGIALTRMIRIAPDSPNHYVPIIALSCNTDPETVQRARDAGVNDFLAKPLLLSTLRTHIEAVMARPPKFIRTTRYFGPDRRKRPFGPQAGFEDRRASGNGAGPARLEKVVRPDHRAPHMGRG